MDCNINKKEECRRLWKEVFGDSDEFISSFMEHHYSEEQMLYIEENGILLSMLHLIPFDMYGAPVAYMYAVATADKARGKGLATSLIHRAIERAKNDGMEAIVTLPADKGLNSFYSQFGFKGRYAVKFETPDNFDFGTGETEKDFITILPFENSFMFRMNEYNIILKK